MGIYDHRTGCVYAHCNRVNGLQYVGQTIQSIDTRKRIGYSAGFQNALNKYGWENFETEILEKDVPVDQLNEREIYWIEKLDTYRNGYNSTKGGEGLFGWNHTEETKQKMKNSRSDNKQTYQYSLDGSLIQIFDSCKEAARVVGVNHKNISSCCRDKILTTGGFVWSFTELSTEEVLQKTRRSNYVSGVVQLSKCGQKLNIFSTVVEASRVTGIKGTSISNVLNGWSKTSGGYRWEYVK